MHEAAGLDYVYSEVEGALEEGLPPILPNTFLYRGVAGHAGRMVADAPVGEVITDQGFTLNDQNQPRGCLRGACDPRGSGASHDPYPRRDTGDFLSPAWTRIRSGHTSWRSLFKEARPFCIVAEKAMEGTLAMLDVVVVHQPNPLPPSSEDNPAAEATRGLENAIARESTDSHAGPGGVARPGRRVGKRAFLSGLAGGDWRHDEVAAGRAAASCPGSLPAHFTSSGLGA